MNKIISLNEAVQISKELKLQKKKILLTGGCFDVLHAGHIKFLNELKNSSDISFVLLESDENIRKYKGEKRPINSQKNRAIVLSAISTVDHIIPLRGMTKNEDYDKLIVQICPDYIALTTGDKNTQRRKEQCKLVGAKLIEVEKVEGISTTNYINNIK